MKIKTAACCFCALLFINQAAYADENAMLASVKKQINDKTVNIELWGSRLASGYADKLLLLAKDDDGRVLTAFAPSVDGGYNCFLDTVKLEEKNNSQVLLSAARGNWKATTEYRVVDFADFKNVRETLTAADNYGVVKKASVKNGELEVKMLNGNVSDVELDEDMLTNVDGRKRLYYEGFTSLTAHDIDNNGTDELFTVQKIALGDQNLADVGAVWKLDGNGEWQIDNYTILLSAENDVKNTVNNGVEGRGYTVLPRKIVLPGGEATYPVVAYKNNIELQRAVNETLAKESENYLQKFYSGEADMAFNVLRADDVMLTVQLISGKDKFLHHHVNIDPQTGKKFHISDLFDTANPDFRKLLNTLNTNKSVEFVEGVPNEWYIDGDKIFLIQNICGQEEASGFALGNLHKYIKNKKLLGGKN